MIRLAIFETHPIQYKVPWFRLLHARPDVELTVFYCMVPNAETQGAGFGVPFEWDIPLLEGYQYKVLTNRAKSPSSERFNGCNTPEIYEELNNGTFDAILINGWGTRSCIQALLAAKRWNIPCIIRGESNDVRPRAWWKRQLQSILVRQYAAALYIGKRNRAFYRKRGVPEHRLFFGPYCVDNARFSAGAAASDRAALRRQWCIPKDAYCFLFCGKLQDKKRPMDVLRALQHLTGARPAPDPTSESNVHSASRRVHLLIAGDGELRASCEQLVREAGLPATFTGFVNQTELPAIYGASDCLVLPSDHGETWGLVVNEAMACGIPAIVSDQVGCGMDLIVEGKTGFTYPCDQVSELARCMQRISETSKSLQAACFQHVTRYSYDALVQGTLDAVRSVARNTPD